MPEPDLVFPNYGDHAYAKIDARRALHRVRPRRARPHRGRPPAQPPVGVAVGDGARLRSSSRPSTSTICRAQLPSEPDEDIVEVVLERVAMTLVRYVPESSRRARGARVVRAALWRRSRRRHDEDARSPGHAPRSAPRRRADDVARLVAHRRRRARSLGGFEFDQEMRWAVTVKAIAYGLPTAIGCLPSSSEAIRRIAAGGRLLQAEAARPTPESKQRDWDRINGEGYGSFHLTRAAMMGFFWAHQARASRTIRRSLLRQRARHLRGSRPSVRSGVHPVALPGLSRRIRTCSIVHGDCCRSSTARCRRSTRQLTEHADELERQIRVRAFAEED